METIDEAPSPSPAPERDRRKDITRNVLTFLITFGFFGVLGVVLLFGIPPAGGHDVILIMIGALQTAWVGVVGYHYGATATQAIRNAVTTKP